MSRLLVMLAHHFNHVRQEAARVSLEIRVSIAARSNRLAQDLPWKQVKAALAEFNAAKAPPPNPQ